MFGTTILGSITAAGIVRVALSSTLADSMLAGKAERDRQTERVIEKAPTSEYQKTVHWCSEGTHSAAARHEGSGKLFMA